jgi:hypothetical protein
MADNVSWFTRQRRKAARFLMRFAGDSAAGGFNSAAQSPMIDDGLDYLLPLIVPDYWPTEKKREAVLASMREHDYTDEQITQLIAQRDAAIEKTLADHREAIAREPDDAKRAHMQEASAPFMDQFSSPNVWERNIPAWPTQDPLREWDSAGPLGTTSTRREILMRTHMAMERNPIAKQAVHITTLFSMGDGLTLKCYNPEVEAVLEAFRKNPENAVEKQEKALMDTLQVDGELFIRFYDGRNGETLINPLKPWEVWWIETERGFPKRPVSYHWYSLSTNYTPGDLRILIEDIPAEEVLHIAINNLAYEQRGRPDLFAILPWLKGYKDWLENRARQNFWRGALLWWVKLIGGTAGQVAGKRSQYRQPPPPGSIVVTNEKEEWSMLDNKVSAGDAAEDGRQIKLMSAIGKGLPEYMLSDGQNANLASASAQQLPALRTFSEYQDIAVNQIWRPIYTHVLQHAIDAGLLPAVVQGHDGDGEPMFEEVEDEGLEIGAKPRKGPAKMIDTLEAFDLSAPELESDDPKTLADSLMIAVANGWASNETASGRAGYDYASEQKKIEREDKAAQLKAYQGGAAVMGQPLPDGEADEPQTAEPAREAARPVIEVDMPQAPAQIINVHVPQQLPPTINIDRTPVINNVTVTPSTVANEVTVQPAPVQNTINVPEAAAPVVNVTNEVQPSPAPNVTNEITVQPATLTSSVKRDKAGNITSVTTKAE